MPRGPWKRRPPYKIEVVAFHRYRTLYYPIPKVANTSLKALAVDLVQDELPEWVVERVAAEGWKPWPFRRAEGRKVLREQRILLGRDEARALEGYWSFAFVRNPFDRLVSCFRQKILSPEVNDRNYEKGVYRKFLDFDGLFYPEMGFDAFVDAVARIPDPAADRHFRSQHTFVSDGQGRLWVDFVGRFERLAEDFDHVREERGLPEAVRLPHLLRSDRAGYRDWFTPDLRGRCAERFAGDLALFGYDF